MKVKAQSALALSLSSFIVNAFSLQDEKTDSECDYAACEKLHHRYETVPHLFFCNTFHPAEIPYHNLDSDISSCISCGYCKVWFKYSPAFVQALNCNGEVIDHYCTSEDKTLSFTKRDNGNNNGNENGNFNEEGGVNGNSNGNVNGNANQEGGENGNGNGNENGNNNEDGGINGNSNGNENGNENGAGG
ncbi:uncharacterized protein ASCRUDRAFT_14482, partial [Ascoidea rubescens DSM 1968]